MLSIAEILFASISAILGSGWLFAAAYTFSLAGSLSLLSWVIGAILVIIIAFVFAELCTMIPLLGSSTRIPHFTHGLFLSFIYAFVIWLGYMFYVPAEIQAIIQYIAVFFPSLVNISTHQLTLKGYALAILCILVFTILSVYSTRWLIKANSILTLLKLVIPVIVSLYIIFYFFLAHSPGHQAGIILPNKGAYGVLSAISTGGIFFAFNGFKLAAELAGDAKRPKIALPVAILGSVVICLCIYLLLQFSFTSFMTHTETANINQVMTSSKLGPFAFIGLHSSSLYILPLIYTGAIVAPFAAGIVYFVSAVKTFQGLSKNGYLPAWLGNLNKHSNPIYSILVNFLCASSAFLVFPGWDKMAEVITILFCISYTIGPINLYTLRKVLPDFHRPFKLPFARAWCLTAFFGCTVTIYWCGCKTVINSAIIIGAGILIYMTYLIIKRAKSIQDLNIKNSLWFFLYFTGIVIVSYIGDQGGLGIIKGTTPIIVLFLISIASMLFSVQSSLSSEKIKNSIVSALEERKHYN